MQRGGLYAWWVVGVLTLISSLSYIDRQILSLLIGPIRHDLRISDTQIGLLTGLAFAAFFAVMGVPLGRLADRRHRVGIIAIGMGLWSLMTSLAGLARSFPQLFLARMGVGVGEASLTPAAYSIFADYFPPAKLGRAIAVYTLSVYIGMGLALLAGGAVVRLLAGTPVVHIPLIGALHSWQAAMLVVGLGSLVFLPLLATVREPERTHNATAGAPEQKVGAYLLANWRTYLPHALGFSLSSLFGIATLTWAPEMFHRSFGWPTSRTALIAGLTLILLCGPATLAVGWLNDRLRARGVFAAPILLAIGLVVLAIPLSLLLAFGPTPQIAAAALVGLMVLLSIPGMLAPTALQLITPGRMRAQVSAVYVACVNLISGGLGPLAVGAASDMIFHGPGALRQAMGLVGVVAGLAATLILWSARKPFARLAAETSR